MTGEKKNLKELVAKIIITSLVLGIASILTPGFRIDGFWTLIVSASLIAIVDFLLQSFTSLKASPFGRGLGGFVVSVIVLIFTSKMIAGFNISTFPAIVGSVFIGIIDMIIPGSAI